VADFVLNVPRRDELAAIEDALLRVDAVLDLMVQGPVRARHDASAPAPARGG